VGFGDDGRANSQIDSKNAGEQAACLNALRLSLPPGLCMPFQPFQYVNIAQARLSGVELETGYDWGAGFATLEGSAINGKNLETGMSLTTVPPYRASAMLGFRFLDDRSLSVGARFTAVGSSTKNVAIAAEGGGPLPHRAMDSSISSLPTPTMTG
jgi:outer membrane receptor protein involved in Fe transport